MSKTNKKHDNQFLNKKLLLFNKFIENVNLESWYLK